MRRTLLLAALIASPAAAEDRRVMVTNFDRVRVEGPYEVRVEAGASPSVVAVGEPRAIDGVSIRVVGTTLVVSPGVNAWGGDPRARPTPPTVRVVAPRIQSAAVLGGGTLSVARLEGQRALASITGAGSLRIADVRADRVDATLVGTGQMTLAGSTLAARIQANGAGSIDAKALEVRDLTVASQGPNTLALAARDTAQIVADGLGQVTVAGRPACTVRGSAPVTCGTARP